MSSRSYSHFKGKYLRQLPAVGKLMEHPKLQNMLGACPRVLLLEAIHDVLDSYKAQIVTAEDEHQVKGLDLSPGQLAEEVSVLATEKVRMSLRRAINATGRVLDEDLGRTPMNLAAQKAVQDVAEGYSTLSVDARTGMRIDRRTHVLPMLSILTGAESGLVVNNNAAAVMLILNTIAHGKEVIVSRSQLIEDDGFRLPDVVEESGAVMISVGATNKTRMRDYRSAIGDNTGAILRVHRSNYRIAGFSQDVSIQELVELGKEYEIPVVDDIGSGCLVDLTQYGLPEEPMVSLSIRSGVDIVCFSGDKLLSGPQAGIVVGRGEYISAMETNSLYRVLRAGKLTIAALEATLRSYLDTSRLLKLNPALRFISRSLEEIEFMTNSLLASLGEELSDTAIINVEDGYSQMGAISASPEKFPTKLISVKPMKVSADEVYRRLRSREIPIFPLYRSERIIMDLRAVQDDEINEIAKGLLECLRGI